MRQAGSVVWCDSGTAGVYHSRGHAGGRQDSQGTAALGFTLHHAVVGCGVRLDSFSVVSCLQASRTRPAEWLLATVVRYAAGSLSSSLLRAANRLTTHVVRGHLTHPPLCAHRQATIRGRRRRPRRNREQPKVPTLTHAHTIPHIPTQHLFLFSIRRRYLLPRPCVIPLPTSLPESWSKGAAAR